MTTDTTTADILAGKDYAIIAKAVKAAGIEAQ